MLASLMNDNASNFNCLISNFPSEVEVFIRPEVYSWILSALGERKLQAISLFQTGTALI